MKTVLQINTVLQYASTGRIAEQIGDEAMHQGWRSVIAYGQEKGTGSSSETIRIGNNWDINLHGIQTRLFDRHGLESKRSTARFLKQMDALKPDVVHLHNIHGYYLNYPLLFEYLRASHIPVVWTLHDCWSLTGHCSHFDYVGCERWRTGCHDCMQLKEYPASSIGVDRSKRNWVDKCHYFNLPDQMVVVAVSEWLQEQVRQSFLGKKECRVIRNGVDLDLFKPYTDAGRYLRELYGINSDQQVLLTLTSGKGDLGRKKGFFDVLELAGKLDGSQRLIAAGLSEDQLKLLPKGVIGVGKITDRTELAKLYSGSDVFLNLTLEDSFPTVNLEALACGTPVITYKTGGSPEAIDSSTGLVVDKGNVQEMAGAVTAHGKTTAEQRLLCRLRAEKSFNKNIVFQTYVDLYEQLLNSCRS